MDELVLRKQPGMYSLGSSRTILFKRTPATARCPRCVRVQAARPTKTRDLSQGVGILGLAAAISTVVTPLAAQADVANVDSDTLTNIGGKLKAFEEVSRDAAQATAGVARKGYDFAAPIIEDAYKAVEPVVSDGVKALLDAAEPAVTAAAPSVGESVKEAENYLAGKGVDVDLLKSGANTAVETTGNVVTAATPLVKNFWSFITTADPGLLALEGGALLVLYFLAGPTIGAVSGLLRGYAGNASPAAALDSVVARGNSYLVDIRTQVEKETTGAPDLPGPAARRYIELAFAETGTRQLRKQLRKPNDLECEVTAILIASLKKLDRGCSIYLMDKNGSQAPSIARSLDEKGFKKCFVIKGGYNGWKRSKLQIKPSVMVANAEIVPPVLGTIFGSQRTLSEPKSEPKALPPPKVTKQKWHSSM